MVVYGKHRVFAHVERHSFSQRILPSTQDKSFNDVAGKRGIFKGFLLANCIGTKHNKIAIELYSNEGCAASTLHA